MKDPKKEGERWFLQAESDLRFARVAVREGFFAQACFICQQSGEKALKALAYRQGERLVLGHSLFDLIERLESAYPDLTKLRADAGLLDQYYVATRYPNGLPAGVPSQVYREEQAVQAVALLENIVRTVRRLLDERER